MKHMAFFSLIKAGTLSGAYLLHGEEEYIKRTALEQIISGVEESMRDLNVQVMESPAADAVITACETLPFFAKRRLVIAKNLQANEEKELIEYLPRVPETALLIVYRRGSEDAKKAFFKACKAQDRDVEFARLSEEEAVRWVLQRANRIGVGIEPAVARHLVAMVGVEVSALDQELGKAAAHAGTGGTITRETLHACVTRNLEYALFPILRDLLGDRKREGLKALTGMRLARGTDSQTAAAVLAWQCRMALSAGLLMQHGVRGEAAIAARIGCPSYTARNAMQLAQRFGIERLRRALLAFTDVKYRIESGSAQEGLALDTAIWEALQNETPRLAGA